MNSSISEPELGFEPAVKYSKVTVVLALLTAAPYTSTNIPAKPMINPLITLKSRGFSFLRKIEIRSGQSKNIFSLSIRLDD